MSAICFGVALLLSDASSEGESGLFWKVVSPVLPGCGYGLAAAWEDAFSERRPKGVKDIVINTKVRASRYGRAIAFAVQSVMPTIWSKNVSGHQWVAVVNTVSITIWPVISKEAITQLNVITALVINT